MSDSTKENVTPEEIVQPQEPIKAQEQPKDSVNEVNWRNAREKMKFQEAQIQEMREKLEALSVKREPEESVADEDFATARYTRKEATKIAKQIAQEELRKREQETFMDRVLMRYPDFEQVVNPDSLAYLEKEMPEFAETLGSSPDRFKMAVATYKAVKKFKAQDQGAKDAELKKKEEKIDANLSKPLSSASVDKRPLAQAHKYEESNYPELWKEMQRYASRVK